MIDTLAKHGLIPFLDKRAFVFPIGYSGGKECYEGTLRRALLSDNGEIECVVSIVPGKLAISYGHSNEVRICKK